MLTTKTWSGGRLKDMRLRRGWSQEELARATETSVTNVSRYERDIHTPGANMVARLAHSLDADEGDFFEDGDPDEDEDAAAMPLHLFERAVEVVVRRELARRVLA